MNSDPFPVKPFLRKKGGTTMEAFLRQDLQVLARDTEGIKRTLVGLGQGRLARIGCQEEDRFAELVEHLERVKADVKKVIRDCSHAVRCCGETSAWGLLEEVCGAFKDLDAVLGDLKEARWARRDFGVDGREFGREGAGEVLTQSKSSPAGDCLAHRV